MNRDLQAVALAALEWNRARLARIEVAKRVPDWPHPAHTAASRVLAEAQAKATLRKACQRADPACMTIDVVALLPDESG